MITIELEPEDLRMVNAAVATLYMHMAPLKGTPLEVPQSELDRMVRVGMYLDDLLPDDMRLPTKDMPMPPGSGAN